MSEVYMMAAAANSPTEVETWKRDETPLASDAAGVGVVSGAMTGAPSSELGMTAWTVF